VTPLPETFGLAPTYFNSIYYSLSILYSVTSLSFFYV
jgi:hypothetical protein